ncbi:MAG TPA: thioesterase family protein, partial [Roseiarcus sp.]|nr:thioesterase family protein [Roseiarcus sp.]
AIERAARSHGLTHIGRLTSNLIRPVTIGRLVVDVTADYIGRNAGHFAATLIADDKEVGRFTALAQRESQVEIPSSLPGDPVPTIAPPDRAAAASFPFERDGLGYANLVETRIVKGTMFNGPSTVWFRMRHPLVAGEETSGYQRVAVAADSGNGISAALDFQKYLFVNCDLTINLFRRPIGEWICLQAQTLFGGNGCGLAESALYDEAGLVGRATQSLAVRLR